jgi:hypothetical protein
MPRYIYFTKLKHLIFINGGSTTLWVSYMMDAVDTRCGVAGLLKDRRKIGDFDQCFLIGFATGVQAFVRNMYA